MNLELSHLFIAGICYLLLLFILAYAAETGVQVVAITDEDPETVAQFLEEFDDEFPEIVAIDPYRSTSQRYGVSGMPTFVGVGADSRILHYQTGYRAKKGLEIAGWSWGQRPAEANEAKSPEDPKAAD